jgi:hypothetical protein
LKSLVLTGYSWSSTTRDATPLVRLTAIERIYIEGCKFVNAGILAALPSLREVRFRSGAGARDLPNEVRAALEEAGESVVVIES